MEKSNADNHSSRGGGPGIARAVAHATCPTCGSIISEEARERILKIDQARQRQLSEEGTALDRERAEIAETRAKIAAAATKAERERWEAERTKTQRELERAEKRAEAEREKQARIHERQLQTEMRKREASERQLARAVAVAEAKAKGQADARARETKRQADEQHRAVVEDLRGQLRTLEQRRRRDEDALKETILDLRRKSEIRDQGHFGADGEDDLVTVLRTAFGGDTIEHHGKGGDVVQIVMDAGRPVGTILYEVKNRGSWQKDYLRQIKRDLEVRRTRHGVLVTRALPSGQQGMCVASGVIVVLPALVAQVVTVLRDGIIAVARLSTSEHDKSTKMDLLFDYLRGDDFRSAMLRVQEKISELREDLSREKSFHDGWWTKRENHLAAILRGAAGVDARVGELLGGTGREAP